MKTFFTFQPFRCRSSAHTTLAAILVLFAVTFPKVQAQCTSCAPSSITVAGVTGGTLNATDNNQTICLLGSGTFNGTINFGSFNNVTLCVSTDVTVENTAVLPAFISGANLNLNNHGQFNNNGSGFLRFSDINNFGSGPTTGAGRRGIINNAATAFMLPGRFINEGGILLNQGLLNTGVYAQRNRVFGGNTYVPNATVTGRMEVSGSFSAGNNLGDFTNDAINTTYQIGFFLQSGDFTLRGAIVNIQNGGYRQVGGTVTGGSTSSECGSFNIATTGGTGGFSLLSGSGIFGAGNTYLGMNDPSTFLLGSNVSGFDNEDVGVPFFPAFASLANVPANAQLKDGCIAIQLPVDLLYFRAAYANGQVQLTWATASETTNDFFTVEKSRDGKNFTEVTRVKGAGNSTNVLTYAATDANPYAGLSYYRLKQTDLDGKFEYFPIRAVNSGKPLVAASVFPNPVGLGGKLQLGLAGQEGDVSVTVYDQVGRQCFQTQYASGAAPEIAVGEFAKSGGLYIVRIRQANAVTHQRIVVQ